VISCVFYEEKAYIYHPISSSKWTSDTDSVDKLASFLMTKHHSRGRERFGRHWVWQLSHVFVCLWGKGVTLTIPCGTLSERLILNLLTSWHHFSWLSIIRAVENDLEGIECDNWAINFAYFVISCVFLWGKGVPLTNPCGTLSERLILNLLTSCIISHD